MKFAKFIEKNSFIHRLDPRSKIALCLAIIGSAFLFTHPFFMIGLFIFVLILSFIAKIWREFLSQTKLLFSVVIMAFVLWSLFYRWSLFATVSSSRIILQFGPISLDELGLLYGVTMPFRVLVLIGTPLLIFMTTPFSDLTAALVQLRVPYKVAFTLGLSLRFVPTISEEMETIRQAQMARGLELERGGIVKKARAYVPIFMPLIVRLLELADRMSSAMEVRAFGAYPKRTLYKVLSMKKRDYIVIAASFVFLLLSIWLRLHGIGLIGR
jgi:energy-coupling factor transport system permease protein